MAFENVYGYESIKKKLLELKGWYDKRDEYASKGIDLPRGVLLHGEAGCGKSLVAGEFAHLIDKSPIVITSKGEITKKFDQAKKESKEQGMVKVVMIDELDLIVSKDAETARLLQSGIDGFSKDCPVFTIATANELFDIPEPLLRSGRFDYRLHFALPTRKERILLMKGFFKRYGIPSAKLDFDYLSYITERSSCADLKLMCNTIRLRLDPDYSPSRIEDVVTESLHSNYAITGKEDRRQFMAIHEAGHALLTVMNDSKVHFFRSLLCDGDMVGGVTICNDNDSEMDFEKEYARIEISLAGRLSEEAAISYHGTGSVGDYQMARGIAANLVGRCGYGRGATDILPRDRDCRAPTEEKHRAVEVQYESLLAKAEVETKAIIEAHIVEIKKMADVLMDKGVLTRGEAFAILRKKDTLKGTQGETGK